MKLRDETKKALANAGVNETTFLQTVRAMFPHGHEDFLPLTLEEMELHSVKNHDYASGGSALGNFERVGAILALYPNLKSSDPKVVALVYALKQLDAVLWGLSNGIVHKVEGLVDRLRDISVYSKIVMCMVVAGARNKAIDTQFGCDLAGKPAPSSAQAKTFTPLTDAVVERKYSSMAGGPSQASCGQQAAGSTKAMTEPQYRTAREYEARKIAENANRNIHTANMDITINPEVVRELIDNVRSLFSSGGK